MNVLIVSCLLLVVLCADALDRKAELAQIAAACRKETGASEEDMMKIRQGKMNAADVKDNMKCTMKCFMVKAGFMNDAGKFNADALKTGMPMDDKKVLSDAVDKCKSLEGPNPCETAYLLGTCLIANKMQFSN